MKNQTDNQSILHSEDISPLSLYTEETLLHVNLYSPPIIMDAYHWHGHIEINIPFGDIEYMFNGKNIHIKSGHIAIFWASIPHRTINNQYCPCMAVVDIPISLFLSWPLSQQLINQITHGVIVQSVNSQLVSLFEIQRWEAELKLPDTARHHLVYDEIQLMIRRLSLDGWIQCSEQLYAPKQQRRSSSHTHTYVSAMLNYIANNYNKSLTVAQIANAVGLNANYAMGLFQNVMQLTIKQYITMMRINHAKALLSDTEKSMLEISLAAGFNSISRFYENFQKHTGNTPQSYRKQTRTNKAWFGQDVLPTEILPKGASDGMNLINKKA